jgi:hypothetical protein
VQFLTVVVLIAFLNNPSNSILLGSPAPSPWFIENVALEPFDLPSGVSITLVKNDVSKVPQEYIVIKNNSSTILYVAGTPDYRDPEFDTISLEFPPGIGPMYKVVNGQAYKWDFEFDNSGSEYHYAWLPDDDYERGDSIWLYVYGNQILSRIGMIANLEPLNQFDGDRPKDVKIPEPQKVLLPIIYGAGELKIPLTVSYSLNNDYRPYQPNYFPDSLGPEMIFCFILISFMAIAALILLMVRSIRSWADKQTRQD